MLLFPAPYPISGSVGQSNQVGMAQAKAPGTFGLPKAVQHPGELLGQAKSVVPKGTSPISPRLSSFWNWRVKKSGCMKGFHKMKLNNHMNISQTSWSVFVFTKDLQKVPGKCILMMMLVWILIFYLNKLNLLTPFSVSFMKYLLFFVLIFTECMTIDL